MKKKKIKPISNTAVNVETQKEYDEMMELCEAAEWKWYKGEKATSINKWTVNGVSTCIKITSHQKVVTLSYHSNKYFKKQDMKIISFQEFLQIQGLATKPDKEKSDGEKETDIKTSIITLESIQAFVNKTREYPAFTEEILTLIPKDKEGITLYLSTLDPLTKSEDPEAIKKFREGLLALLETSIKNGRENLKKLARDYSTQKKKKVEKKTTKKTTKKKATKKKAKKKTK